MYSLHYLCSLLRASANDLVTAETPAGLTFLWLRSSSAGTVEELEEQRKGQPGGGKLQDCRKDCRLQDVSGNTNRFRHLSLTGTVHLAK